MGGHNKWSQIKRQKGAVDAGSLSAVTYETYGPGGVAVLIEALTDSNNRTAQERKHLLSKNIRRSLV